MSRKDRGEIARSMGVSLAKVHNLMRITARPISLETPMGAEGESRWVDHIEDQEAVFPPRGGNELPFCHVKSRSSLDAE